jgi:hypothetical protein
MSLAVEPEIVDLCLSSGLSSGTLRVPRPIGNPILRIAASIGEHRMLRNDRESRRPDETRTTTLLPIPPL